MEAEGDAFVLVAPAEEKALTRIERQIGHRLPRVLLPDFDYTSPQPDRTGQAAHAGHRRNRKVTRSPDEGPQGQKHRHRRGGPFGPPLSENRLNPPTAYRQQLWVPPGPAGVIALTTRQEQVI